MAAAFVQSQKSTDTNDAAAGSVATATFLASLTAGNAIVGHVAWSPGDLAVSTISDGVNTYVIDQTTGGDINGVRVTTFHKVGISAVATPVLTATWAGAANSVRRIHAEEWSGISSTATDPNAKAAQFANGTFGTGVDACTSGAAITTGNGCFIYGVFVDTTSVTAPTVGTGFTVQDSASFIAGDNYRTENETQSAQGSVTATYTSTTGAVDAIHVHMLALVLGQPDMGRFLMANP
jgi:hypothetical protein